MELLSLFVVFFTLHQGDYSYGVGVAADDQAFCMYRKHLTVSPSSTCCAEKAVVPGIDIAKHWKDCTKDAGGDTSLDATAWKIYGCIVKAAAGGEKDEISLQEFSDLMTANYPEDIKTKISGEIKTVPGMTASLTDSEKLDKIRVTYYDVEKEVCEGMRSEKKSYGKIETCTSWKEEIHRAGMCCKTAFPFDIKYNTLMDLSSYAEPGFLKSCRKKLHNGLHKLNASETMESNIVEICEVACAMLEEGEIADPAEILGNTEYWKLNPVDLLKKALLPAYFPAEVYAKAKEYALSQFSINDTIADIMSHEFADTIPGDSNTFRSVHFRAYTKRGNYSAGENYKTDFMRRRFHRGIIHIPVLCASYNKLLVEMERYLFQNCDNEQVTTAAAES